MDNAGRSRRALAKDEASNEFTVARRTQRLAMLAALKTSRGHNATTTVPLADPDILLLEYDVSTDGPAGKSGRFETDLHGNVNILLGGAMLSGVIMVVILMCYCCHKSIRKQRPQECPPTGHWRTEPDSHGFEVFTMDSHAMRRCYEDACGEHREEGACDASFRCPMTPGVATMPEASSSWPNSIMQASAASSSTPPSPPPAYDSLIFDPHSLRSFALVSEKKDSPTSPGNALPVPSGDSKPGSDRENEEQARRDSGELPSYEAALKLEADGYV